LIVLAGEHVADVWNRWRAAGSSRFVLNWGAAIVSLLATWLLVGLSLPRFGCIRVEPHYFAFPARVVALLKQSGVRGNMAVPFEWGEYVLWELGPGVKVSIDGRRETVYSGASYQQSLDFERGTGVWDALLKTAPTDLVLAPNGSPTANLLSRTNEWLPLYQDTLCVLFVRKGLPNLARFVESPIPAVADNGDGLCFPSSSRTHRSVSPGSKLTGSPHLTEAVGP
jgi:hypothetical protein